MVDALRLPQSDCDINEAFDNMDAPVTNNLITCIALLDDKFQAYINVKENKKEDLMDGIPICEEGEMAINLNIEGLPISPKC